jgi:regulatory factor X
MHQLSRFSTDPGPPPNGMHDAAQSFDQNHAAQALQAPPQSQTPGPLNGEADERKKRGSTSGNATNDKELRELLVRNDGRSLRDVAAEVIATDRTSKAEKSKQLFAMLWLKSTCKTAKTSVPRNRVYSQYALRCGTERVIPLNPASFGKLVRVIFPGIQTRRLGVRGESKYHYVDLALIDDTPETADHERAASAPAPPKRQNVVKMEFNSIPRLPADTAAFPPQDHVFEPQHNGFFSSSSKGRLFSDIYSPGFRTAASTSSMYQYELKFPTPEQMTAEDNVNISLPDISPYLPPGTDSDAADALAALYRTHCTSLIDSVRYCKEKQFFRLFASFHGTLTVPVQKLFAQPELAPWVRECDWMMYQKMIRNVAQLTLQVAPPPVLKFLDNISKQLHPHISKVFQGLPLHVLEARLEPATLFSHLLRQMLRVNSTAHAAAVLLMQDQNRDQMWADWKAYVNAKRIIENELPDCGHEEVFRIMTEEIRNLLLPLNTQVWLPDGTYYQEPEGVADHTVTNETVIDRIAAFLIHLPSRFQHAPAHTLKHLINALGSAAMRELTVESAHSFHAWWLTNVFVDEMVQWLVSYGGFLDHSPPTYGLTFSPSVLGGSMHAGLANGGSGSNNESRYSSLDAEFGPSQTFMGGNDVPMQSTNNPDNQLDSRRFQTEQLDPMSFNLDLSLSTNQPEQNHDDSAIALLDDTLDAKFSATVHQSLTSHLTQAHNGVN